jgi:sugar phosphate isomerase/epimerase
MINQVGATSLCYPDREYGKLKRALEGTAGAGYKNVGITSIGGFGEHLMPEKQSGAEIAAVKDWLAEYGLTCTCIVGPHCLVSPNGVDTFKRRIDLAVTLGTDLVEGGTFWPFNGRRPYREHEWREATELYYFRLGRAAEYAASKGVRIAIETHTGLTHTGEQCLPLLERVDTDVVGIVYDTGNILHRDPEDKPEEDILHVIDNLFSLHLKDFSSDENNRRPGIGEGDVDFPAVFEQLKKSGFTGPMNLEGVGGPTAEESDAKLKGSYDYLCSVL